MVVDFYHGRNAVAGCSGTLVAPRVVLTAAHCADETDGARVTTTGAARRTAEVARVLPYDWTDAVEHHVLEHDLALLVLREPLVASSYGRVSADDVQGQTVSLAGRSARDGQLSAEPARVDGVTLSTDPPPGRPFAALVPRVVDDAGGAARRADGAVVGVVMGEEKDAGVGYVARIDDALIADWVDAVTSAVANGATADSTLVGSTEAISQGSLFVSDLEPNHSLVASREGAEPPPPLLKGSRSLTHGGAPGPYDGNETLLVEDEKLLTIDHGSNYLVGKYTDEESTAEGLETYANVPAFAAAHPHAGFLVTHGDPGFVAYLPTKKELGALLQDATSPLVLGSCFSAALYKGQRNAGLVADRAGIDRTRVFGCPGWVQIYDDHMACDGAWVDGNGARLITSVRGAALLNCHIKKVSKSYVASGCQ
jgi:hypothetical protein